MAWDVLPQGTSVDVHSIAQFNHWLGSAPVAATTAATHSTQLLTCSFDYSKLVQAKDGSGAIGAVRGEGVTQFAHQARFHEAQNLQSVVNTGLVFNIASQLVAQKHLADINERLKVIEQQVKGIQKHLEQSRFAVIEAFQEHLQRVGMLLAQGDQIATSTLQTLAAEAQKVRALVLHIRHDLKEAHAQVVQFDSSSWFGSNDVRANLQKLLERIEHLQREYLLGMQCLLVANLILYVKHGGNKEFALASESYVKELRSDDGALLQWKKTQTQVDLLLKKMKPVFELGKSTQANALMVQKTQSKVAILLEHDTQQVLELQKRMERVQAPKVALELENGKVVRGRYLD